MRDNDLVNYLKQYNILAYIDISQFYALGSAWLYEQLHTIKKNSYDDIDRIVLYFCGTDEYKFPNSPSTLSITLGNTLQELDIPEYFVILVSNNPHIQSEVSVTSIVAEDHVDQHRAIKKYNTDSFCILPWIHSYIDIDGTVLACCVADPAHALGNLQSDNLDSVFEGKRYNRLRQDLINNVRHPACSYCYRYEDSGVESPRQFHNKEYSSIVTQIKNQDLIPAIKDLEVSYDNTCNFKCRTCSGKFSSSIEQEEKTIWIKDSKSKSKIKKVLYPKILNSLNTVQRVQFTGGEPTLTEHNYKILKYFLENKRSDVQIGYITNLSNLHYKGESLVEIWKQFTSLDLYLSIDGCGTVAEYLRYGTNWPQIENNFKKLRSECSHANFYISSTVSLLNVESLIEVQTQWISNQLVDPKKWVMNIVTGPDFMMLTTLPDHHKRRLLAKINIHKKFIQDYENLVSAWNDVITYMLGNDTSKYLKKFARITKTLDQHRDQSFVEVFPQYRDLLDV